MYVVAKHLQKRISIASSVVALVLFLLPQVALPGSADETVTRPVMSDIANNYWSGYITTGGYAYSKATGYWRVPCIGWTPGGDDFYNEQHVGVWVGIGGSGNDRLVQVGTDAIIKRAGSGFTYDYYAWYENTANPDNKYERRLFPVNCGDLIMASAYSWGGIYISTSGGQQAQATIGPSADTSTAEFIVERPRQGLVYDNLPTFTVDFSFADLNDLQGHGHGLKNVPHQRINMVNGVSGKPEVFVSDLSPYLSDEFTVTRNTCIFFNSRLQCKQALG